MQAPPLYAYLSHHASAPSSQSSRSVLVCIQYRIQWRSSSILLLYITMEGAAENECSDLLESSKPGPWPRMAETNRTLNLRNITTTRHAGTHWDSDTMADRGRTPNTCPGNWEVFFFLQIRPKTYHARLAVPLLEEWASFYDSSLRSTIYLHSINSHSLTGLRKHLNWTNNVF